MLHWGRTFGDTMPSEDVEQSPCQQLQRKCMGRRKTLLCIDNHSLFPKKELTSGIIRHNTIREREESRGRNSLGIWGIEVLENVCAFKQKEREINLRKQQRPIKIQAFIFSTQTSFASRYSHLVNRDKCWARMQRNDADLKYMATEAFIYRYWHQE